MNGENVVDDMWCSGMLLRLNGFYLIVEIE